MRLRYSGCAMATAAHPRQPVRSVADLFSLDDVEMLAGFIAGANGLPCADDRSRAFWHGWRCGRIEAGLDDTTPDIAELAAKTMQVRAAIGDADWNGRMH